MCSDIVSLSLWAVLFAFKNTLPTHDIASKLSRSLRRRLVIHTTSATTDNEFSNWSHNWRDETVSFLSIYKAKESRKIAAIVISVIFLIFICCCLKDLLERATVTKSQLSTQQQQREVLRQLAAEQSYDPTGKRKVIKYFNVPSYLYVYAPGTKTLCLLQEMCASSSSKFRTAYKNKRPRRATASIDHRGQLASFWLRHCVEQKEQNSILICIADQLQEQQQRYCFPVRPVQRVQHQQQPRPSAPPAASSTVLRLRQPTTSNAAVGVVTPNTTNGNDELQCIPSSSSNSASAISNNNFSSNSQSPSALQTLVNRLFGETSHHTTRSQIEVLRTLFGLDENWNNNSGQQTASGLIEVNLIK